MIAHRGRIFTTGNVMRRARIATHHKSCCHGRTRNFYIDLAYAYAATVSTVSRRGNLCHGKSNFVYQRALRILLQCRAKAIDLSNDNVLVDRYVLCDWSQ